MIDRTIIRSAAVAALKAAVTVAGNSVYSPDDWPSQKGHYPQIVVRTPHERKENNAGRNGPPSFWSTITLTAVGTVEATSEAAAETALEAFSLQIENALLTNGQFIFANQVQQFSSVETSMEVHSEGEMHYGETVVAFDIEVPQYFEPALDAGGAAIGPSLTEVAITITRQDTGETLAGETITLPGA